MNLKRMIVDLIARTPGPGLRGPVRGRQGPGRGDGDRRPDPQGIGPVQHHRPAGRGGAPPGGRGGHGPAVLPDHRGGPDPAVRHHQPQAHPAGHQRERGLLPGQPAPDRRGPPPGPGSRSPWTWRTGTSPTSPCGCSRPSGTSSTTSGSCSRAGCSAPATTSATSTPGPARCGSASASTASPRRWALQDKPAMKDKLFEQVQLLLDHGHFPQIATHDEAPDPPLHRLPGRQGRAQGRLRVPDAPGRAPHGDPAGDRQAGPGDAPVRAIRRGLAVRHPTT